ncbi:MAG: hypothetical protein RBS72_22210 [Sedimentisphaerales bacterium]|jgi:hypothetical protein|nr:hypothetical protein [Sedimentisphaerales bacterium]HOH65651.1 hypothetical protein [Sedimentisphaerales bacterium]HQA90114.1 hypothetical protein [Sedimentisphaerales bacterium]HQN35907.1 hypothetical protein [Sedimentisphaerales bacterium]
MNPRKSNQGKRKAQCRRLEACVNGTCKGKLNGETTGGIDPNQVGARRESPEGVNSRTEVGLSPGDEWITISEAARLIGCNRGVISRWATQNKIANNSQQGRTRRVLKSNVLLVNQNLIDKNLRRDADDLRKDAKAIQDSHP